jgi:hypothetical protein
MLTDTTGMFLGWMSYIRRVEQVPRADNPLIVFLDLKIVVEVHVIDISVISIGMIHTADGCLKRSTRSVVSESSILEFAAKITIDLGSENRVEGVSVASA